MDYYAVVGVSRNATDEQIRDAYRRNARRLHPDRNPDSEAAERFKELTAAYEVLKDPQRRAEYDLQTSIDDSPSVSNSRDTPTSSRNASAEPFGTNKPYDRVDQALLVNGRKAVSDLYQSMESHRRGSMSASVYEVAAEMLDKSFNDFETVLRSPTFETHKPVVIQAAEDFLHNSAPGDYIAPARSSEHLASGSLGMVGLSRVAQVVGSDASPRAKEAAARSIMFAIATALLEEGLIGSCDGTDDPALSAASYEAAKLGALAELEAAASAGNSMVRIRG